MRGLLALLLIAASVANTTNAVDDEMTEMRRMLAQTRAELAAMIASHSALLDSHTSLLSQITAKSAGESSDTDNINLDASSRADTSLTALTSADASRSLLQSMTSCAGRSVCLEMAAQDSMIAMGSPTDASIYRVTSTTGTIAIEQNLQVPGTVTAGSVTATTFSGDGTDLDISNNPTIQYLLARSTAAPSATPTFAPSFAPTPAPTTDPVLAQLQTWIGRPIGNLCYQASVHGYSDSAYHSRCDSPSLMPWAVIVKLSNGRVFGGYSIASCTPSQTSSSTSTPDSSGNFLYSFTDGAGRAPAKFHFQGSSSGKYCALGAGPTFGAGYDMAIYLTNPASSYTSPSNYANPGSNTHFAGTYNNWAAYDDVLVYYFPPRAANLTAALEQLTAWIGRAPSGLCYQASVHGYSASTYHSRCDSTALIPFAALAVTPYRIFGGYSTSTCTSSQTSSGQYVADTIDAFLFLQTDGVGTPAGKFHLSGTSYGKYCGSSYGPTFGRGHDMYINLNTPTSSSCSSNSYASPPTTSTTYYSGSSPWPSFSDVLVYYFAPTLLEQFQTWSGRTVSTLCYQASVHGYSESTYHSRCDAATSPGGLLVAVKLSNDAQFGAFNGVGPCTPAQTSAGTYVTGKAGIDFLYSYTAASTATARPPAKYVLTSAGAASSHYCSATSGPVFGAGDLTVSLSSPSNSASSPSSYTTPPSPAPTFYAGASNNWASYSDVLAYHVNPDPVLTQLESWIGRASGDLCYQASVHGYSDSTYHSRCDSAYPMPWAVIVKLSNGRIFGGYSVATCTPSQTSSSVYVPDTLDNFLYSFTDGAGRAPAKFHLQTGSNGKYCYSSRGPTFGGGHDMTLYLSSPSSSYTNPSDYANPGSNSYFAGSYNSWASYADVFVYYFPPKAANVTAALEQLTAWIGRAPTGLCYQASVHGYLDSTYHSKCDTTALTPFAALVVTPYRIFGGYSSSACTPTQTSGNQYVADSNKAFLYLQSDGVASTSSKFHLNTGTNGKYCRSDYGPTFGAGHDMYVRLSSSASSSAATSSYASPPTPANTYFSGTAPWPSYSDVLVYYFAPTITEQLQSWMGRTLSTLCYQASVHGYSDSTYHSRCDSTSSTGMAVVVTLSNGAVFGGFNSGGACTPSQTLADTYVAGKASVDFLYSFAPASGATARPPLKYPLSAAQYSKYCSATSGPVFGAGDMSISLSSPSSSSTSPSSYTAPPSPAPTYYAGASTNWASYADVKVYEVAPDPVLAQLESWIGRPASTLCYQASVHGYSDSVYHNLCDSASLVPWAVIVKLSNGRIFGGYSTATCTASQTSGSTRVTDTVANFLYSFTDGAGRSPAKFHLQSPTYGKYCYPSIGPMFGGGYDMAIYLSTPASSYTNPSNYANPGSNSYFAGSYNNWAPYVDVFVYYFPPATANVTAALEQLTSWIGRAPGALCYQASVHGYLNPTYHSKCDTNALTPFAVLVVTQYRVFGAYSNAACTPSQTTGSVYVADTTSAFLYLHSDGLGTPAGKYHLSGTSNGKYCSTSYGPTFGGGHDMYIHLSSPTSSSATSSSYTSPPTPANTYYSGSAPWPAFSDVLVYYFPIDITEQFTTWTGRTFTNLCYQASVHGYSESTYHSRCDAASSTGMAVVVKLSNGAVFGAFNSAGHCTPTQTAAGAYVAGSAGQDFLFSHVAPSTAATRATSRYSLNSNAVQYSKYCAATSGPVFGAGDMTISLSSPSSSSTSPSSYATPPSPAPTFYAGAQTNWASYSDVLVYSTTRDPALVQLETWLGRPAGAICYQASVHGYSESTYHTKCDTSAGTPFAVVVKLTNGYVFGGYSIATCLPGQSGYITDTTNNFLFSITNGAGRAPAKFHLQGPSNGKYCSTSYGPTFGGGHDMMISLSSPSSSYTNPSNYANPGANSYYAGSYSSWAAYSDVIVYYFPPLAANVSAALAQLTSWIGRAPSSLCYQASVHGYLESTYHTRCDTTAATPYAVLVVTQYRIFGGYSTVSCTPAQTAAMTYVADTTSAFLYLHSDGYGLTPSKFHLSTTSNGQYCRAAYGPTFGGGHDMHIRLSSPTSSYTSANSYNAPPTPANTYYSGTSPWPAFSDVLVYQFAPTITEQLQLWTGRTLNNLCYQASVHGYSESTYHTKCDTTTLTGGMFVVVKLSNDAVFGAYNSGGPCTPTQTTAAAFVAGRTSHDFLFSFGAPSSVTARPNAKFALTSAQYAQYCAATSGPVFGQGDMTISLSSPSSSSASPSSYTTPPSPAPTYYAGASSNWASFVDVLVYTAAAIDPVLFQLEAWIGRPSGAMCYQASVDGYVHSTYHTKCDSSANLPFAVVVRLQNGAIFGGYSKGACPPATTASGGYTTDDSTNFLYSYTNGAGRTPAKFHLTVYPQYGKYCGADYGPTFGGGHDMMISLSTPSSSYTSVHSYANPGSNTYFAGASSGWSPYVDVTAYYFPL